MKYKCDLCDKPATHHSIEIVNGKKIHKHLCDEHAAAEGMLVSKSAHTPINELLTNFVKVQAGVQDKPKPGDQVCSNCGLSFAKFRESSLLGCAHCYEAFDQPLTSLVERAHEGAVHHVGKVPRRAGAGQQRQARLTQLRKRLEDAVTREDYEQAASLRDDIAQLEEGEA